MRIKDVMKKNLVLIDGERKVIDACKLMGKMHIGSVLVTLDDKPYGIFTERDLLSKVIAKGLDVKKVKVKNYASHPLITVDGERYTVRECARIMSDMKIGRLIITSRGKIKGIFTATDLARLISKSPLKF
jgi:predicted transcriptional regulator